MKLKIYAVLACIIFLFSNCNDVLDRPSLTSAEDAAYWTSESRVRLYANAFYSNFFVGYGVGYETTYAPNANYTFNDDAVIRSTQRNFNRSVPTRREVHPWTLNGRVSLQVRPGISLGSEKPISCLPVSIVR